MFIKKIDNTTLNALLDYHYRKLMDKTITLEEKDLYDELYHELTIEKTNRWYE